MLHRNMSTQLTPALRTGLDDVLGNLVHARRNDDLGRLALLTYWDVRSWARWAHRDALASLASTLVIGEPVPNRAAFLKVVDDVIAELERIRVDAH
ncbi:MAG TPA: hypothetical protein VFK10_05025 [Burkholderiaceae bacterium]|nr:hypothetical protein [Burkholderiaceae bacterium]